MASSNEKDVDDIFVDPDNSHPGQSTPKVQGERGSDLHPRLTTHRQSEDDFAKMTMLSKLGGGFIMPKSGHVDAKVEKPGLTVTEDPESSRYLVMGIHQRSGDIKRTQSARFPRNREEGHLSVFPHHIQHQHLQGDSTPESPGSTRSGAMRPRIPSFRVPSKLRVMPVEKKSKPEGDDDDDKESGTRTPRSRMNSLSFSSTEALDIDKPRSRAATFDKRTMPKNILEVDIKSSPVGNTRRAPIPVHDVDIGFDPNSLHPGHLKRRSISDVNIPMSLQQELIQKTQMTDDRQSIQFNETSRKGFGQWLAKFLLGSKYHPASHRVRRLSPSVVAEMVRNPETFPGLSRILLVGENGVGKREMARTFRNIGAPLTQQHSIDSDPLDFASRGTSISEASTEEIDPASLLAFEYNDRYIVMDFVFAENEEEFVRRLIQKPPSLIIAVYSVCSLESLYFCMSVMDKLRHQNCEIPVVLVGNKCDLVVARTVGKHEIRSTVKQYGITNIEVSALLGEKCPELLLGMLKQIAKRSRGRLNTNSSNKSSSSQSPKHESLTPQTSNSGSYAKSNTIWSRLTKTFSNNAK